MMPAAKMMDPVMGIDIHIIQPPGPVPPLPIPHPFVGMLFDPMELAPFVGASVFVNGMPKATAGSEGKAVPPHIPIGGMFVPPPPGNECEMFMGSATVLFEGEPASYLALPALSCQSVGMPSPPRAKKKPKPILKLPTSVVMPIPAGPPVLIGGPPTISMTVLGMKVLMGALGKAAGKLKKMMKASKKVKKVSDKIHKAANKAMDKLGVPPSARNKVHKGICTVTGHPVDVATGKVFTDNVDFELPGPIPLRWERTWFSTSTYAGPLGHGWHHGYDMALAAEGKGVAVRGGDGRPLAFPRLEPGQAHFLRSEKATLFRDAQGYALRREGLTWRFASVPSAQGSFPLASLSDASGNQVLFAYDAQGRLEAIRDSAGRLLKIRTDWAGRITRILAPHPEDPGQDVVLMTYAYNEAGDMDEARDALDQAWRYVYRNHLLVEEANRNGLCFRFEYDGRDASAKCLRTWGDGGIYDHKLAYDPAGRTTVVENSLGQKTTYRLSDAGLVTRVVNPLGHASSKEYNAFNELVKEVDELGQETAYEYDDRGNRSRVAGPDGTRLEFRYEQDLLVACKDILGGEWAWEYDDQGRLVKRRDGEGRETAYRYEGGRLAAVADPAGGETRFRYGPSGELIAAVLPDGSEQRWGYDRLGRCLAAVDARGNARKRAFDLLGRVRRVEDPDGSIRELAYDPEGNVVRAQDGHRAIGFRYQGLDRLAARTEGGVTVEFQYDTEERLTGIRNEHGLAYGFALDAAGEVAVETGFDGIRRTYVRDAKGRIAAVERAGGLRSAFAYDACDRIVAVEHSNGEKETFSFRADGELLEAANGDAKVAFRRDARGRVLQEDQDGFTVESIYDPLGRRVEMKSSLGARQLIARDAMGDASGVRCETEGGASAWEARFSREILGMELERSLPGGIKAKWTRDKLGRPLRQQLITPKEFRTRDYAWEPGDRLRSIRDSRHGLTTYEHDPLGNLLWAQAPDGSYLFRMPDAVGNLFRSPDRDDRKYGPAGQLLEARGPKGITRYAYDPEGNLTRKEGPDGKVWTYRWNAAGMLAKVERPDGSAVEFTYDALGRRTGKTFRGRTTRWVWDGNNPLHEWVEAAPDAAKVPKEPAPAPAAEALAARQAAERAGVPAQGPPRPDAGTPEAPVTWLFEPDGRAPMAKLVGGARYSIVTDHLGAPLAMFDAEGRESWSAQTDIYGRLTDLKGEAEACPFRFPGQYEDAETGLSYNRFRYYDPESGLYTGQDPIRLLGGLRPYRYVADPATMVDPFGLSETPAVSSLFEHNGQVYEDTNATARGSRTKSPIVSGTPGNSAPNANTLTAHAEVGAMNQSMQAGNRGGKGVLMVQGQPICNYCQSDIKKMGQALDLDELEIHHLDSGEVTTLSRQDMRNVPDGGAKLKDRMPNSCT